MIYSSYSHCLDLVPEPALKVWEEFAKDDFEGFVTIHGVASMEFDPWWFHAEYPDP